MCFGSYNKSSMPVLKIEVRAGKMDLFAAADIPKTGMYAICLPMSVRV